ncbi:hypothetical protein AGLY_005664 [Aphis glycines]|uniref:Uncharacterized protein n=1 Tax=Aphis glycines TaxID=307491 RepID=A0A6G0TTK5_APHGL|nr:hypothetical protein AGLY_005664 [Aphis glycines]
MLTSYKKTGSESPARANWTKTFGKVAEKSKVCRFSVNQFNKNENELNISTHKCKNRPGVATIISGALCIILNWASIGSPPNITADFKLVNFPISFKNFNQVPDMLSQFFKHWYQKTSCFSTTGPSHSYNVTIFQSNRDRLKENNNIKTKKLFRLSVFTLELITHQFSLFSASVLYRISIIHVKKSRNYKL